jgi:rhodanese-related sulfurtransferase
MFDPDNEKEQNNTKAIFVGLFLIVLIGAISLLKSNSGQVSLFENKPESIQPETIDSKKIGKITAEDLAKKIQAKTDLILIDLRSENQYRLEHIVDSINISDPKIATFSPGALKNKICVLIDATGAAEIINVAFANFSSRGFAGVVYLEGGFTSWKNKFNPTITDGDPKSFADQAKVKYITSDDLKKLLETEKNITLVDVRNSADFSSGHLAGATNIFLDNLEEERRELPFGKKIILYDNDSLGAFKAAVRLFDLGFSNTLALSDGLATWKMKGYELVK